MRAAEITLPRPEFDADPFDPDFLVDPIAHHGMSRGPAPAAWLFGVGPGQMFARLEVDVITSPLIRRVANIRPCGPPVWQLDRTPRAAGKLPVESIPA